MVTQRPEARASWLHASALCKHLLQIPTRNGYATVQIIAKICPKTKTHMFTTNIVDGPSSWIARGWALPSARQADPSCSLCQGKVTYVHSNSPWPSVQAHDVDVTLCPRRRITRRQRTANAPSVTLPSKVTWDQRQHIGTGNHQRAVTFCPACSKHPQAFLNLPALGTISLQANPPSPWTHALSLAPSMDLGPVLPEQENDSIYWPRCPLVKEIDDSLSHNLRYVNAVLQEPTLTNPKRWAMKSGRQLSSTDLDSFINTTTPAQTPGILDELLIAINEVQSNIFWLPVCAFEALQLKNTSAVTNIIINHQSGKDSQQLHSTYGILIPTSISKGWTIGKITVPTNLNHRCDWQVSWDHRILTSAHHREIYMIDRTLHRLTDGLSVSHAPVLGSLNAEPRAGTKAMWGFVSAFHTTIDLMPHEKCNHRTTIWNYGRLKDVIPEWSKHLVAARVAGPASTQPSPSRPQEAALHFSKLPSIDEDDMEFGIAYQQGQRVFNNTRKAEEVQQHPPPPQAPQHRMKCDVVGVKTSAKANKEISSAMNPIPFVGSEDLQGDTAIVARSLPSSTSNILLPNLDEKGRYARKHRYKHLRLATVNIAGGFKDKCNQLMDWGATHEIDFLGVVETWLKPRAAITFTGNHHPDYDSYHAVGRNGWRGQGVSIHIRRSRALRHESVLKNHIVRDTSHGRYIGVPVSTAAGHLVFHVVVYFQTGTKESQAGQQNHMGMTRELAKDMLSTWQGLRGTDLRNARVIFYGDFNAVTAAWDRRPTLPTAYETSAMHYFDKMMGTNDLLTSQCNILPHSKAHRYGHCHTWFASTGEQSSRLDQFRGTAAVAKGHVGQAVVLTAAPKITTDHRIVIEILSVRNIEGRTRQMTGTPTEDRCRYNIGPSPPIRQKSAYKKTAFSTPAPPQSPHDDDLDSFCPPEIARYGLNLDNIVEDEELDCSKEATTREFHVFNQQSCVTEAYRCATIKAGRKPKFLTVTEAIQMLTKYVDDLDAKELAAETAPNTRDSECQDDKMEGRDRRTSHGPKPLTYDEIVFRIDAKSSLSHLQKLQDKGFGSLPSDHWDPAVELKRNTELDTLCAGWIDQVIASIPEWYRRSESTPHTVDVTHHRASSLYAVIDAERGLRRQIDNLCKRNNKASGDPRYVRTDVLQQAIKVYTTHCQRVRSQLLEFATPSVAEYVQRFAPTPVAKSAAKLLHKLDISNFRSIVTDDGKQIYSWQKLCATRRHYRTRIRDPKTDLERARLEAEKRQDDETYQRMCRYVCVQSKSTASLSQAQLSRLTSGMRRRGDYHHTIRVSSPWCSQ